MAFKVVILCEKGKQAILFKKAFGLTETKVIQKNPVAFYDKSNNICCVHLSGHLLELRPPEFFEKSLSKKEKGWNLEALPVIPNGSRWPLIPKTSKNARERVRNKALLAGIEWAMVGSGTPGEIAIAVDNDKEGELLGWETLEYFKVVNHPNLTRVLYSELTPKAIAKAFEERGKASDWYSRYLSGLARQYCDWLVGMNITMGLTLANKEMIPSYSALNSGRVVFAICYLFYVRQNAINSYVEKEIFSEKVTFVGEKSSDNYEGRVIYPENTLDPESKQMLSKEMALKIHNYLEKRKTGVVRSYVKEKKSTPPPIGFHRTGLDRHLIKKFGLGLKEIANSLQTLYDSKGLVTYPRVDAKNLDDSMHAEMPEYMDSILSNLLSAPQLDKEQKARYARVQKAIDLKRKNKIFKSGVSSGESHHAIIPTTEKFDFSKLSETEFIIYREVADRLIIQFLPDYESMNVTVETAIDKIICRTTGKTPLRKGWKFLSENMEDDKSGDEDDSDDEIPLLAVGQVVNISDCNMKTGSTTAPRNYTFDEILKDLEAPKKFVNNKEVLKKIKELKIGTDGTRQDHLTDLEPKGLIVSVKRKGRKTVYDLVPTKKLMSLVEVAPTYFKYPETSAYWEEAFVRIKDEKLTLEAFLEQQKKLITKFFKELSDGAYKLSEPIADNVHSCEEAGCGGIKFHRPMKGKNYSLWVCSKCGTAHFDDNGKVGPKLGQPSQGGKKKEDWVPPEGTKKKPCPKCKKGHVYHKEIEGKSWSIWTCTSCSASYFYKNGEIGDELKKKK